MQCPTCHKSLKSESLHGQAVDRCLACNGLWLDHSELGPIVRQTEPGTVPNAKAASCSGEVTCPRCGESLVAFNYAHDSGVFVKKCASCGGIWLESGQLELMAQYRTGTPGIQELGNALADEVRTSNRLQFARRLLRSRLLSGIVAVEYIVVALLATGSLQSLLSLIAFLLLPMVCIWFPDAMGNLKGIRLGLPRPMITDTTPGDIVAIGGWLLLLCPAVVALVVRA